MLKEVANEEMYVGLGMFLSSNHETNDGRIHPD